MPDYVERPPEQHQWVAATNIPVTIPQAEETLRRGWTKFSMRDEKIEVLEVSCAVCRRPYADSKDENCVIGVHLRGGPIGTRKRRTGTFPEDDPQDWGPSALDKAEARSPDLDPPV